MLQQRPVHNSANENNINGVTGMRLTLSLGGRKNAPSYIVSFFSAMKIPKIWRDVDVIFLANLQINSSKSSASQKYTKILAL